MIIKNKKKICHSNCYIKMMKLLINKCKNLIYKNKYTLLQTS